MVDYVTPSVKWGQNPHRGGANAPPSLFLEALSRATSRAVHQGTDTLRHRQGTDQAGNPDGHGQEQMERRHHQRSPRQREIHRLRPHPEDLHAGLPHEEGGEKHRASPQLLRGAEPSRHHRPLV